MRLRPVPRRLQGSAQFFRFYGYLRHVLDDGRVIFLPTVIRATMVTSAAASVPL